MAKKIVVLIDGGFLRAQVAKAGKKFDPNFIEAFAIGCKGADEEILRVLYYDCAPYAGTVKLPVSGEPFACTGSDKWLEELACKDLFAVRLGVLKFRGYKPKHVPVDQSKPLTDDDFDLDFEQKGVDLKIGLDIASYCEARHADRIVLVSNDTDCIPAIKYGRKSGLQIVVAELPNAELARELRMHADFKRSVPWPSHLALN
jgi:uncharacterized LabA/DUF88 family protein